MLDLRITAEKRAHPVSSISRNVPEMFLKRTARTPHRAAWKRKVKGQWVTTSWHEFYEAAAATATFLLQRGLRAGEKIGICGGTGPEWCIADIGGLLAGAVTVGAYSTLTSEQLAYILDHSDTRVAFVEGREQLGKILEQRAKLPRLELIVVWDHAGLEDLLKQNPDVVPFLEVLETPVEQKRIDARVAEVTSDQTAIIVYTSGTTGPPKGAMISHENILTFLGHDQRRRVRRGRRGPGFLADGSRRGTGGKLLRADQLRYLCRVREQRAQRARRAERGRADAVRQRAAHFREGLRPYPERGRKGAAGAPARISLGRGDRPRRGRRAGSRVGRSRSLCASNTKSPTSSCSASCGGSSAAASNTSSPELHRSRERSSISSGPRAFRSSRFTG